MGLMALGTVAYRTLAPETVRVLVLDADAFRPWQFLSSMLLHGGVLHFLFNALFLWVFGRYVEERLGPWRFLVLFLLFEVVGDVAWLMRTPTGSAIGASGAVAGCMGLVLFTAPKSQVLVHWRFGFAMRVRRLPAWFLLGFWILTDLWTAFQDSAGWGETSTAYQAHLGGYLAGCLSCWVLRSPLAQGTGWYLPRAPRGGERLGGAYGEMLQSEAMWRTIEEHQHSERDGGGPPEPQPAPPPPQGRQPEPRPPSRGFWG
jgi:membrane associated rhomboid family serine protease